MKRKYPRTFHAPFSPGSTNDDKIHSDISFFENKEIIITEKMDGENTTFMNSCIYARSLDSNDHLSRHWVKGLWGKTKHNIPDNWKICGENLLAKHSIFYKNLSSYFLVFSIWDENDVCLSWDDTTTLCDFLNLEHVPVIWRGLYEKEFIENFKINTNEMEGFVIRITDSFPLCDFKKSVVKWVRKDHVDIDDHWMYKKIIKNKLK